MLGLKEKEISEAEEVLLVQGKMVEERFCFPREVLSASVVFLFQKSCLQDNVVEAICRIPSGEAFSAMSQAFYV